MWFRLPLSSSLAENGYGSKALPPSCWSLHRFHVLGMAGQTQRCGAKAAPGKNFIPPTTTDQNKKGDENLEAMKDHESMLF